MRKFIAFAIVALIAAVGFTADYTPMSAEADQTVSGDLTTSGNLIETASTASLTNGATLTPTASLYIITGIGGANDTTNTVALADATAGQKLTLIVDSASTNLITIADSGNAVLSSAWLGDNNDAITLVGVSTKWVQVSESDN
jgi:hypothetical protein